MMDDAFHSYTDGASLLDFYSNHCSRTNRSGEIWRIGVFSFGGCCVRHPWGSD